MVGTTIGSYEIRSALGVGGMGEVYRAHDAKLGRDVALKVLPPSVSGDADRIARFRREAQVLASLNHANIAAIHGLEDLNGVPVLVLELVDGPTLADRLVHGAVPVGEALIIARQTALALEAAHEHAIVHRDLKPANIKLRPDGVVKVLDFGLAKAIDGPAKALDGGPAKAGHYVQDDRSVRLQPDLTASPTITSPAMTRMGVILGTASYMSPEQARGLVVDRGADIWAWGSVLYEMLTGTRAFGGTDTTEVIAAVIRGEPDWSRLPPETPASVHRLLRRCLEKDPKRRLADIRDARFTLEDVDTEPVRTAAGPRTFTRERLAWASALLLCLAAGAALLLRGQQVVPPAQEMHVDIATPPTTDPVSIAISPDGQALTYVASADGRSLLWIRSLVTGEAKPFAGTQGASFPFWSPDSRSIGFFANERLFRIDVDGGSLKALASAPVGAGGIWSREGVILFTLVPDAPIYRVSDSGGKAAQVPGAQGPGGNRFPQFLPDGHHYLYFMAEAAVRGVYVGNLDNPDRRRLFDADAPAVFVPPARILFQRAGTLFMQHFDPTTLTLEGSAVPLAKGVVIDSTGGAAVSASATGSLAYRVGSANRLRQLAWFDRVGTQIGDPFPRDPDNPINPAVSPDGRQVVLSRVVAGNSDLWLQDVTRVGAIRKITTAPAPDISPVWSPDGKRIAYGSIGSSGFSVFVRPPDGEATLVFDRASQAIPADWSRDGKFILFRTQSPAGDQDLGAVATDGSRNVISIARTSADERTGQFSPDGKWVAFESTESGPFEVYVQSFPEAAMRTLVSTGGGRQVRWGPDGRELFYIASDGRLMRVSLRIGSDGKPEPGSPEAMFMTRVSSTPAGGSVIEYDVSRDGQKFLMNTLVEQTGAPITLIVNAAAAKP